MLNVKFSHKNIPDRVREFTCGSLVLDEGGKIICDDVPIGAFYKGGNGQYYRVWDDETFYKIFSKMEVSRARDYT